MSWVKVNQLNEKRAALKTEAMAIIDKAEKETRDLNGDEKARFAAIEVEAKGYADAISRLESVRSLEGALEAAGIKPTLIGGNTPDIRSMALGREQRMADAVRNDPSIQWLGNRNLSLGKIVKGLALGDWSDAADEQRSLAGGSAASGGVMLPMPISAQVIDLARNASAVVQAGAKTIPMTSSTLKLARVVSDVSVGWRAENAAFATGDPVFEPVLLTAKTLGGIVKTSIELAEDVAELDTVLYNLLSKAMATELDRAALRGSGSGSEPLGLKGTAGIQTMATVGAVSSYAPFSRAAQKVMQANGTPNGIIVAPRTLGDLSSLTDSTGQPLNPPKILEPLTIYPTNNIPTTLGTGTDESEAYVGQWDDLWLGIRSNLYFEVNRHSDSAFGNGQIHIRCYMRGDCMVSHPSHFVYMSGLKSPT